MKTFTIDSIDNLKPTKLLQCNVMRIYFRAE